MDQKLYNLLLALFCLITTQGFAQITIKDSDLQGGGQVYKWTNDNEYLLDGFVFLEEGSELWIEAGTVIRGKATPSNSDLASTLIITRGAKIYAQGTARQPIIFTAEIDDLDEENPILTPQDRGLWGGLIILGTAPITDETEEVVVEGLPEEDPRSLFGGSNDADNSGVVKYVSIRHGGAELAPGNEINGLTLGGVGYNTIIDHIEVLANSDDGIEWFGGSVNVSHAVVGFCGDDAMDYDTGWRGRGQFWFIIQGDDQGDNGGEHDGAKPDANTPSSNPVIYNATFIGSGVGSSANNEHALLFRDGSRGTYANSIFTDYANYAIQVEDRASGVDSRSYMEAGELNLLNNIWFGFGQGSELNAGTNGIIQATSDAEDLTAQFLIDHLANNNNTLENPLLGGISRTGDGGLDPRPSTTGPAYSSLADLPAGDCFFQEVDYKGAFGNTLWFRDWTGLDFYGLISAKQVVVVKDGDLTDGDYLWTNDNEYHLDGFVFLEGGSLTIEEGTIIKGLATPSTSDLASTLIITRGAQIFAKGSRCNPIVLTAEIDDVKDNEDMFLNDRGLWGGLIILGNAPITDETDEVVVEGLPEEDPRSLFGGDVPNDNSGYLKYVSIRHGGAELAPGNEINGLTLGGVGSATTIEFVDVFANSDDGIEWFGGTVSVKYASVAFCGDDSYDYDTGWLGDAQFFFTLQGDDEGDNGGEHDGAKPDANTPSSNPNIYNATYIGTGTSSPAGNEHALLFRDGSRGTYANSIFTDFANFAIQVEDRASGVDSRSYMEAGELNLLNNIWFGFGEGSELNAGTNGIIQATSDAEDATAQFLIDHLTINNNTLTDPGISISRMANRGFDPRPGAAALSNLASYSGSFHDPVAYKGAFSDKGVWNAGWTALSEYEVLDPFMLYYDETGNVECQMATDTKEQLVKEENGYLLVQNQPNPTSGLTDISFTLPEATNVSLFILTLDGTVVSRLVDNDRLVAGEHVVSFNASNLPNGIYFYTLTNEAVTVTNKMVVQK